MKYYNFICKIIVILLITTHFYHLYQHIELRALVNDLTQDYFASYNLLHNESIYSMDNIPNILKMMNLNIFIVDLIRNYHPPFISILYIPFTFISYHATFLIINVCTIIFSIIFCYFLSNKYKINFSILLVLFFLPNYFFSSLSFGNINYLIFLIIGTIWYLEFYLSHTKTILYSDILIGFLLTIATFIKIFPGVLFLYFFLTKKKNICISFIVFTIILTISTFLIVGCNDIFLYYTKISKENFINYAPYFGNISLIMIFVILFGWKYPLLGSLKLTPCFNIPEITIPTYITTSIVILLLNTIITIRYYKILNELIFSLWLVSMLLLSPISWLSIGAILTIPILLLWKNKKVNSFLIYFFYILLSFDYLQIFKAFTRNGQMAPPNVLVITPPLIIVLIYIMIIYTIKKTSNDSINK